MEALLSKTDENGVEWLSEDDLAQMKGCADEATFNLFVERFGGRRIDAIHHALEVQNADYVFPEDKVIIELKTIETEIHNTDQFREKMTVLNRRILARFKKGPLSLDPVVQREWLKGFVDLYRPPIARLIKKANAQIKSTSQNLGYADYKGVLLLVNDGLKELPPRLMLPTLGRVLTGSCSSIRAVIYLTNHYVIIPGDEYGRIIWAPLYANPDEDDQLVEFVNRLGKEWFDFCEELGLPSDDRQRGPDISLIGSRAAGSTFPIN